DALVQAVEPVSNYPTAAGHAQLRAAVADWVQRRHGVTVDPDRHVLPTAGSKEAIFHLPLAVVDPHGDKRSVAWGEPGYPVYGRGALFSGGISHPVPLTERSGWRLDLSWLPPGLLDRLAVAWINHPHNPTGATTDLGHLRTQVEVARRHDILLCSDECYQEVWFDEPAPSVLEVTDGDMGGVLAFVSLSKRSGMTGYRSGAIIGDEDLIRRLRVLRPNIGTGSPDFVQAAATAAWSDQDHVDERRAIFAAKRDVLLSFLASTGHHVSGSQATFYVWMRAAGGDDAAHAEALLREGIIVSPGRAFGPNGTGWLRLALVPTVEDCRQAVAVWQAAIDEGRVPV
ncbi:MAG: aminotransferase class I/II-fold pyridoxal phosphate-dependent enzyme, partial [Nitriliruptorales bacterium]|nr:aminotransferase class I/II-fold pyridoxal phosphate-dependent enzyme [Nitriliruptorales bacterium]